MASVAFNFASMMRFADGTALKEFALAHRLAHQSISTAISAAGGPATSSFDVADGRAHDAWELLMLEKQAPMEAKSALDAWLQLHAVMHQSEYDALNLGDVGQSFDLTTVDMSKSDEFYGWMQNHQQIHDTENAALGITT